ncbi:MAG: 3-oxoacyl-[acyl-carrier-protein] reductase [Lachnospiraceae bacterium]|nr:3-oxoacyl-[acyl-carrier-protein] reductase [Lachnospiraceae bacterium]
MNLEGQTALVTGGSRGIGRAICVQLAEMGANVVINYAGNKQAALETAELCKAYGHGVLTLKADVSKEADWETMLQTIQEHFDSIDILVNNAGITKDKLMMAMKEEDFDSVIDTNLKGTFLGMKLVSKLMIKKRYGRIINMSSIVGLRGNAGQVNYAASKAGIIGMTKSIAKELASRNITVNAVAPGMIGTDMTAALSDKVKEEMAQGIPAKRVGTPEDVAYAVAMFAAKEAGYLTGQVLCVDGGMAV